MTAMNPTPLGEGKTTTAIGLGMALKRMGHRAVVTLRQPSLGPVFGIKGGGTGGGKAQISPMEDINLHLTGDALPIRSKIETIVNRIFGGAGVIFEEQAQAGIELAERLGLQHLPICMAKTPASLSHDPALRGRPTGFIVPIKELRILAGAGFLTALCSGIQLMPGLPKRPAGERIDLDPASGEVVGLS